MLVHGSIADAHKNPLFGIPVRIYQAAANGSHRHPGYSSGPSPDPGFRYMEICQTDRFGHFAFLTVVPGKAPLPLSGIAGGDLLLVVGGGPFHEKREWIYLEDLAGTGSYGLSMAGINHRSAFPVLVRDVVLTQAT